MNSALTVEMVVRGDRLVILDGPLWRERAAKYAKRWGDGRAIGGRFEPKDEALSYGQMRHYFGHIVGPLSEWNGDFKEDWHIRLKTEFLPEGKTSIRDLNYEEMRDYVLQCEVYAHTAHPEAFELFDKRHG